MQAVFKKMSRITFIIFLILDLIWLGLCVFFMVEKNMTAAGDIFAFSFVTIIFFSFTIIPFLYNHKAYLYINDNKIVGKFGFFKRLECNISEVTFVLAQNDTINIVLKDRKYYIMGIKNAYAISAFIQQKMPFSPCKVTNEAVENIKKRVKDRRKNIIFVICGIGLSFAWLFITIFLTGARDLPEFSRVDWIIFSIMCILEIPTIIAMFIFAIKSRKGNIGFEKQIYDVKRSVLETAPLLWGPGDLRAVLVDILCSKRITVYCGCVESNPLSTCCNIEILDENFNLQFLFQTETFIMENFDEEFEGLVNLTDKIKNTSR